MYIYRGIKTEKDGQKDGYRGIKTQKDEYRGIKTQKFRYREIKT